MAITVEIYEKIRQCREFDTHRLEHVSEGCIRVLATCDFIGKRQNVIMVGNPGSGKTHLATALGISACCADFKERFYTAGRWQQSCLRRFRKADYQSLRNPLGNSTCS